MKNFCLRLDEQKQIEQEWRIAVELARRDPVHFSEFSFVDEQTAEPWKVAPFQAEWHELMSAHPRVVIEAPREFAKSSTVLSRVLWELGRNTALRIKFISCSDVLATKRLSAVAQHIEGNEALHAVFPNLKPSNRNAWTKHALYVERELISGEPSVEALGVLSSSTGSRADLIIFDDPVDARNSIINPALQEKVRMAVFENCINFLGSEGRAVYICTPWTFRDVTHDLEESDSWVLWKKPAIIDGVPLWPERWSLEALEARKAELPLRVYQRQFELRVIAEEGATFSPEAVARSEREAPFPGAEGAVFYAGCDLAMSARGNYFVMVTGAETPDGQRHVVDVFRARGLSFQRQVATVKQKYETFGHEMIMVENNGYQKALEQALEGESLPVKGYTTTAMSKRDEEMGIPGLAGEIERGKWEIWDSEGASVPLLEELRAYPFGEHDDTVLAAFFLRQAMQKGGRSASAPRPIEPHGVFSRKFPPQRVSPFKRMSL